MGKRDADADDADSLDVAVADMPINQAQGNPIPVRPGDQQRAMSARLGGAHCDN